MVEQGIENPRVGGSIPPPGTKISKPLTLNEFQGFFGYGPIHLSPNWYRKVVQMPVMTQPWKHPRSGIYYFRREVPHDIRHIIGRREWKRSLKTRDLALARPRFAAELAHCEEMFTAARAQLAGHTKVLASDAPKLADRWAKHVMEAWENDERLLDDFIAHTSTASTSSSLALSGGETAPVSDFIDGDDFSARARAVIGFIKETLEHERLPLPDGTDLAYSALINSFFARWSDLCRIAHRRSTGDWRADLPLPNAQKPLTSEKEQAKAKAAGPKLSSVLDAWAEDKRLTDGENRSTAKTIAEFATVITRFIELHGDLPVSAITRGMIQEFRNSLGKMPTRGKGMKGLTAPELIAKAEAENLPTASLGTVKKQLRALSTVLNFAYRRLGAIHEDPVSASGIIRQLTKAAQRAPLRQDEEKAYTWSELMQIFTSPVFKGKWSPTRADYGEAFFWLPLLYIYTGARREEMAQLLVADVLQEEETGIWYLYVRNEEDQRLKTGSSRRKVPLHNDLIQLGFIDYASSLPQQGRLFPKLTVHPNQGYGHNFGKLWSKYLKEVVRLNSKASPNHGFRHAFKTLCRQAAIDEYVHDWITGHAAANVGATYGTNPLSRMKHELDKFPSIAKSAGLIP